MKPIKTVGNSILVVEIPENTDYYDWLDNKIIRFKCGYDYVDVAVDNLTDVFKYAILGKLSELSEEECGRFVYYFEDEDLWMSYNKSQPYKPYKNTAKKSLISLLQSNKIDTSKELLIVEIL